MKELAASFFSGLVFAIGLAVSGMTQASKVIGFLDFFGAWDPSLLFVMMGAIAVHLPAQRFVQNKAVSLLGLRMQIPSRKDITARLVIGSALFGAGWGLGGFAIALRIFRWT